MIRPVQQAVGLYQRVRPYLPFSFFAGGFLWDAITLGSAHSALDLWLMLAYYLGAAAILILVGRGVKFRWDEYFNWVVQFCFGSLFSAFTVLYFISSGGFGGTVFVLLVSALLVGNEFLEERYSHLTLSWAFFTLVGAMFLNFAIPHLAGALFGNIPILRNIDSVSPLWFYLSTALALGATYGIRRLTTVEGGDIRISYGVAGLLVLLFLLNWIPPVPLVKKELAVVRDLNLGPKVASARIEKPPFWHFWSRSEATIHQRPGESVHCYASIFAPSGLKTKVVIQWYYDDPQKGWTKDLTTGVNMRGGREAGFRTWSNKQFFKPGKWIVAVETENGRVIAKTHFHVEPVPAGTPVEFKDVKLN